MKLFITWEMFIKTKETMKKQLIFIKKQLRSIQKDMKLIKQWDMFMKIKETFIKQ